ncbi:LysR family transcriptional regulator [Cohnella faecalis]|uniref:LysR family transcriptional regulator n=1 Tax=Cohnella faecalis TaxID=2315694 RepID=A0A398CP59_9BACL|nr:LysR family transcriptional regulator [Cohnella faecalis]RIE05176.1 LysR family transcriptional regulator [Cohnella faecalis]
MDIRTIKTFQTIVKHGSFQRAADELQYSQSTITMHIQKLETDVGLKLLERGKKLRLTEAGRLLNQKADVLLKDYDHLNSSMAELVQGEAGVVRLGVMEPTASYRLPAIIGPFLQQYPKVQISIQIGNTTVLHQMLEEDQVDWVICTTPDTGIGHLFEPLFVEKLGLLMPDSHPLAVKEAIYLRDLQNENLLVTTNVCPFRRKLESSLLEKGGSPYNGMEIGNMAALKFYVQASFGLAVVPYITAVPAPAGTVLREIEDLDSGLVTGLLRKESGAVLSSASIKLIECLREGLTKPLQPIDSAASPIFPSISSRNV